MVGVMEGVKVGTYRGQPIYQIRSYSGQTVTLSLWLAGILAGVYVVCPGEDIQITRAQFSYLAEPQNP